MTDRAPSFIYILASTPRSGSTLISHVWQQTGVLGQIDEFINSPSRPIWERDHKAYLESLLAEKTSANGVFGIKMHFQQFMLLFMSRLYEKLGKPSFVYLERRDKLAQAISLVKAFQQDWWNTIESDRARAQATYDFDEILKALDLVFDQHRGWQQFFATFGIPYQLIYYEDFVADPVGQTLSVASEFGIRVAPDTIDLARLPVRRQADGINEEWRERFRADARARQQQAGLGAFLGLYPYLRHHYTDPSTTDIALANGLPPVYSPAPHSSIHHALTCLQAAGLHAGKPDPFTGKVKPLMNPEDTDAILAFQRERDLFVEPCMSMGLANRIVEEYHSEIQALAATDPMFQRDLTGEWMEITNPASGLVTIFSLYDRIFCFNRYVQRGTVITWTAGLSQMERNHYTGTLRHGIELRVKGYKDAWLELTADVSGQRLEGFVTPEGGERMPITFMRIEKKAE